jgi:Ca2+-binding EF-hand superfamily protein
VFELKLREDEDERELREAFRVLDKGNKVHCMSNI